MSEVIAKVGYKEITEDDLQMFVQALPPEQQMYASMPQMREQMLEQLKQYYMFALEAEEQKLDETDEYKEHIKMIRYDLLQQMAIRNLFAGIEITEDEKKAYYEENKEQFMTPPSCDASHILVDDEEKCQKIKEEIESGAKTFEEAAKEYSTCPSAERGGNLGVFGRGQMVAEFDTVAFNEEIGKVTGPVKTQFGYHLILVNKRDNGTQTPYDVAAPQVQEALLNEKRQAVFAEKVTELKAKYC